MTQDNRLWFLIARRLSGETSPEEAEELQGLIEHSPDKQYLLDILHSYFTVQPFDEKGQSAGDMDLESRFRRIIEVPSADFPIADKELTDSRKPVVLPAHPIIIRRMPSRRRAWYAAAAAIFCLLTGGLFYFRHSSMEAAYARLTKGGEVIARPGTRTKLVLPDGTQVWLNSNSKLKYSEDYSLQTREVGLEGEAYFDVVKDALHPFIVHTSDLDVKVLGTTFNIKSYAQDETIEATLLKGAIEISREGHPNTPKVILKPNEKLVFFKHGKESAPAFNATGADSSRPAPADLSVNMIAASIPDSNKVETAWLYNRLVFNGDSFKDLADKMERWYNVKIHFASDDLYKYRFAGAFANESVQEALDALQMTAPFTYKINDNDIEIYGKH